MSDPVISPDGKHMWTGNEWIPSPPTSESSDDEKQTTNKDDLSDSEVEDKNLPIDKEILNKSSINDDGDKSAYVIIVLLILVSATIGGYLMMNRELSESRQDYWSNQNYGFRFTDDDVYVLVNLEEYIQEYEWKSNGDGIDCQSALDGENWSLVYTDKGICVFDTILFNATTKENSYEKLCFGTSCIRLDFEDDTLYSTLISNDSTPNNHCHLSMRWVGSVDFSNSSVRDEFNNKFYIEQSRLNPSRPEHCDSIIGLDLLHQYVSTAGLDIGDLGSDVIPQNTRLTFHSGLVESDKSYQFIVESNHDVPNFVSIEWQLNCVENGIARGNFYDTYSPIIVDSNRSSVVIEAGVIYSFTIDVADSENDCAPYAVKESDKFAILQIFINGPITNYGIFSLDNYAVGTVFDIN